MVISKNNMLRLLSSAFLFGMILFLWGAAIYYIEEIYSRYPSVSIRLEQEQITQRALMQAMERESKESSQAIQAVAAWNMRKNQILRNTELNTESKINLIAVFGDMSTIYPVELKEGSIPSSDDYAGCLLDDKTAYTLFGTAHSVGHLLTYQEEDYCIRGIIKSEIPVCLIQEKDENYAYSNVELICTNIENGDQKANTFLLQNGVNEAGVLLEGSFYAKLLKSSALLPAWFLALYLMFELLTELWRRRSLLFQVLVGVVILLALWGLLRWSLELKLFIPQRLIPTNWSDLDFWGRKVSEWRRFRISVAYLSPNPKDIMLLRLIRISLTCLSAATLSLILLLVHRHYLLDAFRPAWLAILFTVTEGIILVILWQCGLLTGLLRAWILLPVLLTGFIWIAKSKKRLKID